MIHKESRDIKIDMLFFFLGIVICLVLFLCERLNEPLSHATWPWIHHLPLEIFTWTLFSSWQRWSNFLLCFFFWSCPSHLWKCTSTYFILLISVSTIDIYFLSLFFILAFFLFSHIVVILFFVITGKKTPFYFKEQK